MTMANPLLESCGEPPKACVTNSNCPPANLKGKGNHQFVQTIGLLTWHSLCFNHLLRENPLFNVIVHTPSKLF